MTSLANLRERLLANENVKAEYDRLGPIYALVGAMVEARHEAGMTQQDSRIGWARRSRSLRDWRTRIICPASIW